MSAEHAHLAPRPRDVRDETKLAAEALVRASRIPAVVLRIGRVSSAAAGAGRHRQYRGVAIADVVARHLLALRKPEVTGTFIIAGAATVRAGSA